MILPPSACALNWIWNDLEISPSHTSTDPHGISIVSMGFLCHHVYKSSYEVVVSAVTGKICEHIGPRLLQIVSSGLQ